MKILVVHNMYGTSAPSGENTYVRKEIAELRANGYEVATCFIENDGLGSSILGKAYALLEIIFPLYAFIKIWLSVATFRPERIHFHNTFPRIGWLSLRVFSKKSFLTLHNYRLFCANGMALRNGKICTNCADKRSLTDGRTYNCYRNSYFSTIGVQLYIVLLRKLANLANMRAIFCFSSYQKQLIIRGFNAELRNIRIKNNCHPISKVQEFTRIPQKPRAAFVGRFSEEKGLKDLLKSICLHPGFFEQVDIVGGSSKDLAELQIYDGDLPANVVFHGRLAHQDVSEILSSCHLLLVPSTCLEGQPTVVFEAIEQGCLPIVSEVPTLLDFIQNLGLATSFDFKNHLSFDKGLEILIQNHNAQLAQINNDVASSLKNFALPEKLYLED